MNVLPINAEENLEINFAQFWQILDKNYPTKTTRKEAREFCLKLDKEEYVEILEGLFHNLQYWNLRGKTDEFIPNPPDLIRFLKKQRWADKHDIVQKSIHASHTPFTKPEEKYVKTQQSEWIRNQIRELIKK